MDLSRFNGKPLLKESVRAGIHQPEALIQRVVQGKYRCIIRQGKLKQVRHLHTKARITKWHANGLSTFNEWGFLYGAIYRCRWVTHRIGIVIRW